jgi:hypothetical protein
VPRNLPNDQLAAGDMGMAINRHITPAENYLFSERTAFNFPDRPDATASCCRKTMPIL